MGQTAQRAGVTLYDEIGAGYAVTRRADPRIAAMIEEALGDARTVVNVGAGAGSYEPPEREVLAVEPSQAMIDQRPPGSAPCVKASAAQLPLQDSSFDAATALMTVHHWDDLEVGLAELRRVARSRVVVFSWDASPLRPSWLANEYLPELGEIDLFRFPPPEELARLLGGAELRTVPIPHDCEDGFIEAFWARPEAYLDPAIRAGMSGMRALAPGVVERGIGSLRADLESGEWERRHAGLRDLDELDVGYRLVVAKSLKVQYPDSSSGPGDPRLRGTLRLPGGVGPRDASALSLPARPVVSGARPPAIAWRREESPDGRGGCYSFPRKQKRRRPLPPLHKSGTARPVVRGDIGTPSW